MNTSMYSVIVHHSASIGAFILLNMIALVAVSVIKHRNNIFETSRSEFTREKYNFPNIINYVIAFTTHVSRCLNNGRDSTNFEHWREEKQPNCLTYWEWQMEGLQYLLRNRIDKLEEKCLNGILMGIFWSLYLDVKKKKFMSSNQINKDLKIAWVWDADVTRH